MSFLRLHHPTLLFLFLSLSLFFIISHLPSISAYNIIQTRYKYGLVNPQHQTPLPNIVDGIEQHYILSNLPVNRTGEKLLTFTTLFAINPDVTGQTHSIIIHVARPTPAIDDDPLRITYVRSIRLDNIQSDRPISLLNYNIELQKGDYIAVSVPNNAIFIRVGHNNVGLNIPYGVLSVTPGSSDTDRTGTFHTIYEGSTDTQFLQLCSGFTTYGSTEPGPDGEAESSLVADTYFFWEPVTQYGELTKISAVGLDFNGLGGERGIQTLDISVIVARPDPNQNGELRYLPSSRRDLPAVADETWYDVTPTIQLQPGDVVGMISHGDSRYLTLRPFATPDQTRTYYSSIEIDGSGALLPEIKKYEPRFAFIIKADIQGDPQFAGFQGQQFQFHGLADEHFNLISAPQLQLNAHFVYLSSGRTCDYNETLCFQHPGTYLDVLGFTIPSIQGDVEIKIAAGAHADGLRLWMGQRGADETTEIELGKFSHGLTWVMNNQTYEKVTIKYTQFGMVLLRTPLFDIKVVNSDYFFNLELAVLDAEMLRVGAKKHTITDHDTCHHDKHGHAHVNEEDEDDKLSSSHVTHDHGAVEKILIDKYHVEYPLHGLIGQTWRNVLVCGKHWMGSVGDYLVSSLFGDDYYYNYYSHSSQSSQLSQQSQSQSQSQSHQL